MKKVILNYNDYKSENETYKDFYRDIFIKLDGSQNIDFEGHDDLGFNGNILSEFLWYSYEEDLKIIMVNVDLKKIEKQKTMDDYMWGVIIRILKRFVAEYPNNTLEFRNE